MKSKHLLLTLLLALFVPWAANAQQTAPYNEGFESMSSVSDLNTAGWELLYQSSSSSFLKINTSSSNASTGSKSLNIDSWDASSSDYVIVGLPLITNKALNELQITFSYKVTNTSIAIGYLTDANDANTFTSVQSYSSSSSFTTKTVELNTVPNTAVRIAIKYTGYYRCYVDDVKVETIPSCPKPTLSEVADEDITSTTATIRWTPSNESQTLFDIYYSINNTAPDGTTTPSYSNVSGTSKEITGLNPVTQYYVWLRGNCGTAADPDISGGWTSAKSFMTDCGAVGIGYTCGFEGPNTGGTTSYPLPACWTRTGTSTYYPRAYNGDSHLGSYCLYFYGKSSTNASAMLPEIEGGVNGKRLSFYLKVSNAAVSMSVGYLNGENTFVEVESVAPTTTYSYQLMEVDFANIEGNPTNMVLKFKSTASSSYYAYIDDLELKAIPTCFRPTMATNATNIGPTTATVSWTAGSTDQDHWDVYYCASPYTAPTATTTPSVENTADNPCTLTGLTPSTSYRVWVRGNCGTGDVSEWSTNYCTFTTPAYCADMQVQYSTITFSDITYNSANVGWTIAGEATAWKVQCSQDNTFATIDKEVIANTNSAALSGLTAEKTYYVRIAPYCAEAADYTPWSSNKSFSTPESCPAPVLAEPTNTTAYGATLTWTGTSDHYDVMVAQETITTMLNADFEDNQIPSDLTNSTTYPWTITDADKHAGTYAIKSGGAGTGYAQSDLTLVLELTNAATISFWYKASSEFGYDYGRFLINGTQKFQTSGTTNSWAQYTFDLTTGTNTLVWRYYKDSGTDSGDDCFYVDDIKITSSTVGTWQVAATNVTESPYVLSNNAVLSPETDYQVKLIGYCPWTSEQTESNAQSFTTASSCETPSNLQESEVTNESAKITWDTHGLTTFNLRYRTGTEEWETKNNVACPYTIEGLDGNTTYEVQVQATCNTEEWSTALSFTTKCDLVTDLPWSEDFESYSSGNFSDPCWVNEHIAGSSTYVFQVYTSSNGTNTTHQLQLPDQNDGNMTKLVLPGMTLPNDNYAFFIDVYRTDNYSSCTTEGIRVFASTNGEIEGATELAFIPRVRSVQSGIIPAEDAIGWYTYALPINMSGNCYIILRGESKYGNATNMDNFMVASCYPVGTLSLVEYGSTSAKLSWTLKDNTQTAWDVAYKMEGETNFTIVSANTNENYLLEGLTPEKAYTVKVRANCGGGDYGVWSNEINFTTPEACPVPTGLAINEATKTAVTADLNWTGSIDVDSYDIRYRTAAGYDGIDEQFNNSGLPTDWTRYSGLVDDVIAGTATLSTTTSGWSTNSYALGTYNVKVNIYGTSCKYWLVTPEFDLPTGAVMSFKLALTDYGNADPIEDATAQADDRFVVLVYADNQWTNLREWNNSGSEYVYNTIATTGETVNDIDISEYAGKTVKFAFYGESTISDNGDNDLHIDDVTIGAPIAAGAWNDPLLTSNTTNVKLTDLAGGTKYDVQVRSGCSTSDADWSETLQFTTLPEGTKVFTNAGNDGLWNTEANWVPAGAPAITESAILRANATIASGTVATAKKITFGATTPTLTINDGGQLQTDNTVTATVKKNITGYGAGNEEDRAGYYLIANPLNSTVYYHTSYSTPNINSTGIREGNYDLYSWSYSSSDGLEWRNYETSSFSLYNGTGYLYANENNVELTFTGTVKANNGAQSANVYYTAPSGSNEFSDWNLLGNPFVCNAYLVSAATDGTALPYYKMNEAGSDFEAVTGGAIAPMEGIFYQATEAGTVYFTRTAPSAKSAKLNMNLRKGNKQLDNAILVFGGDQQLGKFTFRANSSKVYMPQDGKDYAIVSTESNIGEMPVNFKAENNGTYTLSFTNEEVSFAYLHLIDNMTGIETDLLANPSYTFEARTTDYASRFKLVFATGSSTGSDTFAYYSNGNWVINNEGRATLQVVDVNGRILKSESINGCANVNFKAAAGIYMIRLVNGDNVKVQKVVVR